MELNANDLENVSGGVARRELMADKTPVDKTGMRNTDGARMFLENVVEVQVNHYGWPYHELRKFMIENPDAYMCRCSAYGLTMDEWMQLLDEVYAEM